MTEKKTLVSNLEEKDNATIIVDIEDELDVVHEYLMDGSVGISSRIKLLDKYYNKYGESQTTEIISRLATLYQFSGTKILEKYLYEICVTSEISSYLKIISAKSLCSFNPNNELGYKSLNIICQNMKNVATPCKIEAICLLMFYETYKKQSLIYFCRIINNPDLDCDYRYKTILSLENKDIPDRLFFLEKSNIEFFNNKTNRTLYRILSAQYLIQKCKLQKDVLDHVETTITDFARDTNLDYNLRADSADVILRLGTNSDNILIAREIIMMLGRQDGNIKTIFDNAQNVHIDEIEQSVLVTLEFLSSVELKTLSGVPGTPKITFDYIKKQVDKELDKTKSHEDKKIHDEKVDKINISLNRIYLDRALYSKYNLSLLHIILKIWSYITSHKSEEDMKNRLVEELIDMSGTCSSGLASRLINVLSGYGEFNLSISWRDQIIANFNGRLNARARDITDEFHIQQNCKMYGLLDTNQLVSLENFQGDVLSEMTVNSNDFNSRINFLHFFRKNMLSIREELYEEFKVHITDTDFDLYIRAAIAVYETGGYV
jgi:hypothetical protein